MDEDSLTFDARTDASLLERLWERLTATRRRRLAAVLALVGVAVVTAIAVGGLPGSGEDVAPVERVPDGADAVVVADASAAEQPATRTLVEGVATRLNASGRYAGPTEYRALLQRADDGTVAPLGGVETAAAFGRYPANDSAAYAALVVVADWDTPTAVAAVEQGVNRSSLRNTSFVRDATAAGTVYRPTTNVSLQIGVLADGYVIGTPPAVRDALAVGRGESGALDGPLRTAYDGTADGGLRYAARVPADPLPDRSGSIDTDELPTPDHVSGAAVASNGTVEVTARLHASTTDDATTLEDLIPIGILNSKRTTADTDVAAALDNLTVDHTERRVTVTYAVPAETASAHAVGVVDRAAVRLLARIARRA